MPHPYQPSQLRLLHGVVALLSAACWISGLVIYSNLDGRLLRWPWRIPGEWVDLHGSLGLALLVLATLLAAYAITLGAKKLKQLSNGLPLLALAVSLISGLFMDEDWLRERQLDHLPYLAHLGGWILLTLSVFIHLAGVWRRGGMGLARSMLSLRMRAGDQPAHWPGQWLSYWRQRNSEGPG